MATNTYVALDKVTVSGSSTTTVTFTVPSGYTDLFFVTSARNSTSGGTDYYMRFNSDTASNYSYTQMIGNGSSAASDRVSSASQFNIGYVAGTSGTAPTICRINIQNYSNTSTYKTILYNWNSQGADSKYVLQGVGVWRKTPEAITSVSIYTTSGNMVEGSTFSLYGIKAWEAETTPKATGGYVYEDSSYWYHAFPFSGTFTPNQSLAADVLVVAGGGGGGNSGDRGAGGGGAGGLLAHTSQSLTATNYAITIGSGGARLSASYSSNGFQGNNSQFAALTASVGGGGGGCESTYLTGDNGGSGGGGGANSTARGLGGSQTSGQGYPGGNGYYPGGSSNNSSGGGGGGAGGAGGDAATGYVNGAGGVGSSAYSSWGLATNTGENISGTVYYAGGGGGAGGGGNANNNAKALGGYGGGAAGNSLLNAFAPNALVSTGGGGGGQSWNGSSGGGGSGIVIVRYAK
jgi:hypothetical protein